MRKTWCIGAAASLLGLVVLVWLGGPPIIKSRAESALSTASGRSVTLGHVKVQPFALQLTLEDLRVAGLDDKDALFTVDRVVANVSSGSLWRLAPVIESLEITRPVLRLTHLSAGQYDVDDLIARFTPAPGGGTSEPARFALYNVQVRDGEIHLDDRPVQRRHEVVALQLSIPFLSNLATDVAVKVEPRLAFKLNGAAFDTHGQATPFATTRAGTWRLAIERFDLAPYLDYAPKVWPVRLQRGLVDSRVEATFAITSDGTPSVVLNGEMKVSDLAVTNVEGAALFGWKRLDLHLRDVQPLARRIAFERIAVDGPVLHARRLGDGGFDGAPARAPSAEAIPTVPLAASDAASTVVASPVKTPWHIAVDAFTVDHGRIDWTDETVAPPAGLSLVDVALKAERLSFPPAADSLAPLSVSASIRTLDDEPRALGAIAMTGTVHPAQAKLQFTLDALSLDSVQPYLNGVLVPKVSGRISGLGHVDWASGEGSRLRVNVEQSTLDGLQITEPEDKATGRAAWHALALKQLRLEGVSVDVLARRVLVNGLRLKRPVLQMEREGADAWNVQRWMRPPVGWSTLPAARATVASAAAPPRSESTPPWTILVQAAAIDGGQLRMVDVRPGEGVPPVRTDVSGIDIDVRQLAWAGSREAPPARVRFGARIGNGQLDFEGQVGFVPLDFSGGLAITRFPIQVIAPYVSVAPGVALARAEAGFKGQVQVRVPAGGPDVQLKGDVLLGDVLLQSRATDAGAASGEDLLQWQALALRGVRLNMAPGTKPRLVIDDAALNELRARLVITEQGRLNLQDAAGGRVGPQSPSPSAGAASSASGPNESRGSAPAPRDDLPMEASIGQIRITNGRVEFSDNFVRPRYSADLTQLNGRLGAIDTQGGRMAELELKGRAAGTADLEVSGHLNPLGHPLTLDIKARASDLELAPLSPYAAKYVGYAVDRGKLSMDVAYRIDPDGQLDARNQVVINQLTFGDAVPSPQATTLPVRLAVSLLKDRHGVIDINLPISGSLNDPTFSVGALVVKVLGNLIARAVTSPFSLLAGGNPQESSVLPFVPGSDRLTSGGVNALDRVAAVLTERPALKLTITGTADLDSERDAFRQQALMARLKAERRKEALATGGGTEGPAETLQEADRTRLLTLLYRQTDLPDKPRNALGLAKALPMEDMERMLKAHIPADEDVVRELALQRAVRVRDVLVGKGLPAERLFLAAPKGRGGDSAWTPSVALGVTLD